MSAPFDNFTTTTAEPATLEILLDDGGGPPRRSTIDEISADLSGMLERLRFLVGQGCCSADSFVEIAAIWNNVSYVFLYLESNATHVDYRSLLPWRDRFFADPLLLGPLGSALRSLRCENADVEKARLAFLDFLAEPGARAHASQAVEAESTKVRAVLAAIAADMSEFLARLGVPGIGARAEVALYALADRVESDRTRRKLYDAWRRQRDGRLDSLVEAVDRLVSARWEEARSRGHESVVAATLQRCGIAPAQAEAYVENCVQRAVASQRALAEEIAAPIIPDGATFDVFGRYLRKRFGDDAAPALSLASCLDFALQVARRVFGIELEQRPRSDDEAIRVDVFRDGRLAGRILFDLWAEEGQTREANFTRGLRNRTDWRAIVQVPVAHVSCRFRRDGKNRELINFQNAHSLFHEFGHALNHIFITRRLPNQSGLEYLPLERLETLSMWFEKWIFHDDFEAHLANDGVDQGKLAATREIKLFEYRRSHLDRAVSAALDLMIHSQPALGVREAFDSLDVRFGIGPFCDFGALVPGFAWPMMQAHPGAYFAYLWGAGRSAELFAPYRARPLANTPEPQESWITLAECFDPDSPGGCPPVEAVFGFYGG